MSGTSLYFSYILETKWFACIISPSFYIQYVPKEQNPSSCMVKIQQFFAATLCVKMELMHLSAFSVLFCLATVTDVAFSQDHCPLWHMGPGLQNSPLQVIISPYKRALGALYNVPWSSKALCSKPSLEHYFPFSCYIFYIFKLQYILPFLQASSGQHLSPSRIL